MKRVIELTLNVPNDIKNAELAVLIELALHKEHPRLECVSMRISGQKHGLNKWDQIRIASQKEQEK